MLVKLVFVCVGGRFQLRKFPVIQKTYSQWKDHQFPPIPAEDCLPCERMLDTHTLGRTLSTFGYHVSTRCVPHGNNYIKGSPYDRILLVDKAPDIKIPNGFE